MEGFLSATGRLDVSWVEGEESALLTEEITYGSVVVVDVLPFAVLSLCGFFNCFAAGLAGCYGFAVACSSSFSGE